MGYENPIPTAQALLDEYNQLQRMVNRVDLLDQSIEKNEN